MHVKIGLAKRGGRVVLVGLSAVDAVPVPIGALIDAELDIHQERGGVGENAKEN